MEIDGILVVNLDKRPERWGLFRECEKNWETAFGQTPIRFSAVLGVDLKGYDQAPWFKNRIKEKRKRSWGGKAGATLSHRNAIQHASDQGWENVLIVEDDAFITAEVAGLWKHQLSLMADALPNDWAAIYLYTAKPFSPCRVVKEQGAYRIIETAGAFGCVAYVINQRNFKPLLNALPDETNIWPWVARYKAIDLWFSQNLNRYGSVYAVAPSPVEHQVGPSDITMTAESEWTFDGSMSDLALTSGTRAFSRKMGLRKLECIYEEMVSFLRFLAKRCRGL